MTCSHDCFQGRACPARQACELPEVAAKSSRIRNIGITTALVVSIALALAYVGPMLDHALDDIKAEQATAAYMADAQAAAQAQFRKELAEAAMCRETHGESLVRHTVDGQTVCVPREYIRRKNQTTN